MASQVDIANLALASIGTRSTIAALTEQSAEGLAVALQYNTCLDAVLSAAHWNFARKQVALSLLKDGSLTPPDDVPQPWLYEYAYPTDCVSARYVMPSIASSPNSSTVLSPPFATGQPVPFIISSDVDSNGQPVKVILCNEPQAVLVYTFRLTIPSLYDAPFVIALSNYIGSRLAMALTGDKTLARTAFEVADRTTKDARASNGNEGITIIDNVPDWIRVRGYEADVGYSWQQYVMGPTNLQFIT